MRERQENRLICVADITRLFLLSSHAGSWISFMAGIIRSVRFSGMYTMFVGIKTAAHLHLLPHSFIPFHASLLRVQKVRRCKTHREVKVSIIKDAQAFTLLYLCSSS